MRFKPLRWILLIVIVLPICCAAIWLWYAPPLRPSNDYSVIYSIEGEPHSDAKLFRPLGITSRYYIFLPQVTEPMYHWLSVDVSRRVADIPLLDMEPFGSECVHRDQAFGVRLTDGKIDDGWKVDFTQNSISLSNPTFTIQLVRR